MKIYLASSNISQNQNLVNLYSKYLVKIKINIVMKNNRPFKMIDPLKFQVYKVQEDQNFIKNMKSLLKLMNQTPFPQIINYLY